MWGLFSSISPQHIMSCLMILNHLIQQCSELSGSLDGWTQVFFPVNTCLIILNYSLITWTIVLVPSVAVHPQIAVPVKIELSNLVSVKRHVITPVCCHFKAPPSVRQGSGRSSVPHCELQSAPTSCYMWDNLSLGLDSKVESTLESNKLSLSLS